MRQLLTGLAAVLAFSVPAVPAHAQQGSLQVSAAAPGRDRRSARGSTARSSVEPDLGLSWLQPGRRFGIFQLETPRHAARRTSRISAARIVGVPRRQGRRRSPGPSREATPTSSPAIGDYRLTNLFTPSGRRSPAPPSPAARPARSLALVAGRASALAQHLRQRSETLDQTIGFARGVAPVRHRLELSARASRIRTTDLKEFTYTIAASDQAGGGAEDRLTPELQLVADGSVVSYQRVGIGDDGSATSRYVAGANWLHKRGWLQVNASHFSPGDFAGAELPAARTARASSRPANTTCFDRVAAVGRVGGVPPRTSIRRRRSPARPAAAQQRHAGVRAACASASPRASAHHAPGRAGRSAVAADARRRPSRTATRARGPPSGRPRSARPERASSATRAARTWTTGTRSSLLHAARLVGAGLHERLAHRAAVRHRHVHAQRRRATAAPPTGRLAAARRSRFRGATSGCAAKATSARNVDLLTQSFVPRESVSLGLNGQLTRARPSAFNVNVDRSPHAVRDRQPVDDPLDVPGDRTRCPPAPVPREHARRWPERRPAAAPDRSSGIVFADWNGERPARSRRGRRSRAFPCASAHRQGDHDRRTTGKFSFLSVPGRPARGRHSTPARCRSISIRRPWPPCRSSSSRGDTQRVSRSGSSRSARSRDASSATPTGTARRTPTRSRSMAR